jgi:tetratricopeptide (TPR) repeat protein
MNFQLPTPEYWQQFEKLCRDVWRILWNDPNANMHGRAFQNQHGVDISGNLDGTGDSVGVQCKLKEEYNGGNVSIKEIEKEIKKAETYQPPLKQLIVATTGRRDAEIQEQVRLLREKRLKEGKFPVYIWFWEDIADEVKKEQSILATHYPQFTPDLDEKLEKIIAAKDEDTAQPILDVIFEQLQELLNINKPRQTLELASAVKESIWKKLNPSNRYKLLRLKALAYLGCEQTNDAAHALIENLENNPTEDKAESNAAWGYLLLDKNEEAKLHAKKAIEMNHENIRAHSILAQLASDSELPVIIKDAPTSVKDHIEFANHLARRALELKNYDEAARILRESIKKNPKEALQARFMLQGALLESALKGRKFAVKEELTEKELSNIQEAKTLLQECFDEYKNSDNKSILVILKNNLSGINASLGLFEEALKHIEESLLIDPDNLSHQMRRVELLALLNRRKEARDLLEAIRGEGYEGDGLLMLAELLRLDKEFDAAEKLIAGLQITGERVRDRDFLLAQIYLDKDEPSKAQALIAQELKGQPENIFYLINASKIEKGMGKIDEALTFIQKASEKLTNSSSYEEIKLVADALYDFSKYAEALKLYIRITDPIASTENLQKMLDCYYKIGEHAKALDICKQCRATHPDIRFIAEIEADIYERADEDVQAEKVYLDYLKMKPNDWHMRIRLARLYGISGQIPKISGQIEQIPYEELKIDDGFMLAHIYAEIGQPLKALEIGYELRRKFFRDSNAHLNYILLLTGLERPESLKPQVIGKDCVVYFENGVGKDEIFIIEDKERTGSDVREIHLSDPRAKEVIGKKTNDEFTLVFQKIKPEKAKIKGFESKFFFASAESGQEYSRMNPNNDKFSTIPVSQPEEGKIPDELLAMMKQAGEIEAHALEVGKLYEQKRVPLGFIARRLGRDLVEVGMNILLSKNGKLITCIGDTKEQEEGAKCFSNEAAIPVIDAITLLLIHYIGAEELVVKHYKIIAIARDVKLLFEGKIRELERMPPAGLLSKDAYTAVSPESVKNEIERLKKILKWINEHCTVMPLKNALSISAIRRKELQDLIGKESLDTILLASEEGHFLFSDDFALRVVAFQEFNVRGIWTQLLMMRLLKTGELTNDEYSIFSLKMIEAGVDYISINEHVLMLAARESKWLPMGKYEKMINILSTAEEASVIRLAVNFLFELMHHPLLSPFQRTNLILSFLNGISKNKGDLDIFLQKLIEALRRKFFLSSIRFNELLSIIIQWANMQ